MEWAGGDPKAASTFDGGGRSVADGRFKLVGNELRVADGTMLDFESAVSHDVTVRVTDSGIPALSYDEIGSAAMLSQAMGGLAGETFVFAMPGSTNAVKMAMSKLIVPELPHLVGQR